MYLVMKQSLGHSQQVNLHSWFSSQLHKETIEYLNGCGLDRLLLFSAVFNRLK